LDLSLRNALRCNARYELEGKGLLNSGSAGRRGCQPKAAVISAILSDIGLRRPSCAEATRALRLASRSRQGAERRVTSPRFKQYRESANSTRGRKHRFYPVSLSWRTRAWYQKSNRHCCYRQTCAEKHHCIANSCHQCNFCAVELSMQNSGQPKRSQSASGKCNQAKIAHGLPRHLSLPSGTVTRWRALNPRRAA